MCCVVECDVQRVLQSIQNTTVKSSTQNTTVKSHPAGHSDTGKRPGENDSKHSAVNCQTVVSKSDAGVVPSLASNTTEKSSTSNASTIDQQQTNMSVFCVVLALVFVVFVRLRCSALILLVR